jgi:putative ABC transport system ATP-binding protein
MNTISPGASLVRLAAVSKSYGTNRQQTQAVRDISLEVLPGHLYLLLGPSGSGKTTLLTLMAGLLKPSSGTVVLFGNNIAAYADKHLQQLRARHMGFVFQNFLLIETLTALENVKLVLHFAGKSATEAKNLARALFEQLGIEHLASKLPHTLSRGEQQRVALARAMANGGELIVADEPTASLESQQGLEIIRLLQSMAKEGKQGVVVATHDLRLVEYADHVLYLRDGALVQTCEGRSSREGAV